MTQLYFPTPNTTTTMNEKSTLPTTKLTSSVGPVPVVRLSMSSPETTKELIERYFYKGWNKCNEGVMRDILDEKVKFRGAFGKKRRGGLKEVLEYMKSVHAVLAKHNYEVEDIIVGPVEPAKSENRKSLVDSNNVNNMDCSSSSSLNYYHDRPGPLQQQKASVRLTGRGLHRGTFFGVEGSGHEVSFSGAAFFTIGEHGKIIDLWVMADIDGLKKQLGATSESTAFQA